MALGDILNRDLFRFRSISQNPGFFERFLALLAIVGCAWGGYRLWTAPAFAAKAPAADTTTGAAVQRSQGVSYGLVVARPISGSTVGGDHILLDGTVQVDGVTVSCNGARLQVQERYFRTTVALQEGQNVIEIAARGREGEQREQVIVIRDLIGPEVRITQPSQGAVVAQRVVTIRGDLVDDAPARVSIGGKPAALRDDAVFQGAALLEPGENVIPIVAEDRAGNRTTFELRVTLDSDPPIVVIQLPIEGARVRADTILVRGQVDEAVRNEVLVNGIPVPVRGKKFETTLRLGRDGRQSIIVNALDEAGNATRQAVSIVRDTRAPRLSEWAIADGTLTGVADEELLRAFVDGVPATVSGVNLSGKLPIRAVDEVTSIKVRLIDLAGNEETHEVVPEVGDGR